MLSDVDPQNRGLSLSMKACLVRIPAMFMGRSFSSSDRTPSVSTGTTVMRRSSAARNLATDPIVELIDTRATIRQLAAPTPANDHEANARAGQDAVDLPV